MVLTLIALAAIPARPTLRVPEIDSAIRLVRSTRASAGEILDHMPIFHPDIRDRMPILPKMPDLSAIQKAPRLQLIGAWQRTVIGRSIRK